MGCWVLYLQSNDFLSLSQHEVSDDAQSVRLEVWRGVGLNGSHSVVLEVAKDPCGRLQPLGSLLKSLRRLQILVGRHTANWNGTYGEDAFKTSCIFQNLARDPHFDNVMRCPGHSPEPSGFLPVAIEGMAFFNT